MRRLFEGSLLHTRSLCRSSHNRGGEGSGALRENRVCSRLNEGGVYFEITVIALTTITVTHFKIIM